MKSLFATLVIVGLATCTIASEAVNRGGDRLREATSITEAIPYHHETEKYRHRENLGLESDDEDEEEGIFGSRVAGSKKSRSESLEKLLKGGDAYRRDREVHRKKKNILGGEEALLTRDNKHLEEIDEAEIRKNE